MKLRRKNSFLLWAGVCALAVFAPACGDDDGDEPQIQCPAEQMTEGAYSFGLETAEDDCAGVDVGDLIRIIDPGPYGPVALPSFAELQQGPVLEEMELPVIGTVPVQIFLDGDVVRLSLPDGDVLVPILADCTATIGGTGTFCPVSTDQVNATLEITIKDVVGAGCGLIPIDTPCSAILNLRGFQQAG